MTKNRRYQPKKASIKRIAVSIVLMAAIILGAFMLLTKNEKSANENEHIKKVEKINKPKKEETKKKEEPKKDQEDKVTASRQEGSVTNDIPATGQPTTTKEETNVVMPKNDTSAIIANAKTQVYTIVTDLQQGSGFLFNKKGDIITNAHVAKDASYVLVSNEHGQEFQGQVIGISKKTDVALIRVPELEGKDPLVLDTAPARLNTPVIAIGSPNNKGGTSTEGKITNIGAEFTDEYTYSGLYEMTARLHPGSSGGPLINAETGNVIGINSIILTDQPEIGYAIPIKQIMNLITGWSNKDVEIDIDNDQDFDNDHRDEAYLGKDLIKDYIDSFYDLVPLAIKDPVKRPSYESYILPGSTAQNAASKMLETYTADGRKYKDLKHSIGNIQITDDYATAEVDSTFTYVDKNKQEHQLKEKIIYKIVIDDYADYQFKEITINSTQDDGASAEELETPEQDTDDEETPAVQTKSVKENKSVVEPKSTEPASEEETYQTAS
ncbi:S1C family serine protease [Rummeliibacillus sp. G93]|uniref:S1C family serine protease n=1 Tax=Rummeliibacillus sp. G93 TaxID=2939494 RepID=UPI00201BEA0A|nr:S1C family serine protease [Rummeliibacillus sp. G93]UQW97985.1 S1C family serine protease [Rummeliibacillus sp. G93]